MRKARDYGRFGFEGKEKNSDNKHVTKMKNARFLLCNKL